MAVGHSESWESHTGTTGSASEASFPLFTAATIAAAQAAVVFVVTIAGTDNGSSVTWDGVSMNAVPYTAHDTDTEPGSVKAYFLDACNTGASKTCTITRTNNATVMYAVGATVTAAGACEVYNAGVKTYGGSSTNTAATTSGTTTGTLVETTVDDGSPGTSSLRYATRYTGAASPGLAGVSSTLLFSIDFTAFGVAFVRETTAGQGARNVGFDTASDDLAAILLAIREVPADYPHHTFSHILPAY